MLFTRVTTFILTHPALHQYRPLALQLQRQSQARTMASVTSAEISKGFPNSTARPSSVFRFVGCTPESTDVVRQVLEENDRGYDIYGKVRFAHNHFPHSILTRYSLGATPELLRSVWSHDKSDLTSLSPHAGDHRVDRSVVSSLPASIDASNWTQWLGKRDAYSLYLAFFHSEIEKLGVQKAVQKWVFSPEANGGEGKPRMVARLLAGVVHPFIHLGFALEFEDVIVAAEGLAQAAIHDADYLEPLYPPSWPHSSLPSPSTLPPSSSPPTALSLYAHLSTSPEFEPEPFKENENVGARLEAALGGGKDKALQRLVAAWGLKEEDLEKKEGWEEKVQEIGWLVTLLACGTHVDGHPPAVDFFLMHTLTSSIFLPSYMSSFPAPQRKVILESYLLVIFHLSISRGRPQINLPWLMSRSATPTAEVPGKRSGGSKKFEGIGEIGKEEWNPWLSIVDNSIAANDSHVPKAIRSLILWDQLLGSTPSSQVPGAAALLETTDNKDAQLDGSVFVRSAGVIMDVMGWIKEGQAEGRWAFDPMGYEEAWEGR